MASLLETLATRAGDHCELCAGESGLRAQAVAPHDADDAEHAVLVCDVCAAQLADDAELNAKHWFCLQTAIWSEVPAVQVVSWRMAHRLRSEGWAVELLEQAYLADEVLAWAKQGLPAADDRPPTHDSNGTALADGDSVTLIKDLDVKGANFVAKRGTLVKGIRLTDDPGLIEGKVNGTQIVLKTEFLKRAG